MNVKNILPILVFVLYFVLGLTVSDDFASEYTITPNNAIPQTNFNNVTEEIGIQFLPALFTQEQSVASVFIHNYLNFIIYYISLFLFYLLLKKRFNNCKIALAGTTILFFLPRVFSLTLFSSAGLFFSFSIIALYFFFRYIELKNLTSLTLFIITGAIATTVSWNGLIFPVLFFINIFFD